MAMIARWIISIVSCALLASAFAHAGDVPGIVNIRFRSYSTAAGLPQATARAFAQDKIGFLWVGTQDGLARFDGYGFKVYRHDRGDAWSLSDNHVTALVADEDGSLWVGTLGGGLDHYDPELDRFTTYRADPSHAGTGSLASNNITALLLDRNKRLWVASTGGRLQWFDRSGAERNEVLRVHDSPLGERPPLRMVRSMIELHDGSLLLGSLDGVWQIDTSAGTMHEWRASPDASLDVYALAQAADDDVWVGSAEAGLYRFDGKGALRAHYRHDPDVDPATTLHDDSVRALLFDRSGALWIAGNAYGLARMDTRSERFTRYEHRSGGGSSISANRLYSLFEDRDGLLIVGSWVNGFSINSPRSRAFTQIEAVAGDPRTLPARPVLSVFADADGTLWMGVIEGGGLIHLDLNRGVIGRYVHDSAHADSLSSNFVQFITRTRDGSLWVATGGGLNRMRADGKTFEHVRHDPDDPTSLASDNVLSFHEDRLGTQWAATADRGLDERCAGCSGFRHHQHDPTAPTSLADNTVNTVLEMRSGEFWVATRGGLQRLDRSSGRFESFLVHDGADSISSNLIMSLTEDRQGDLWIGTQGGGIDHRIVDAGGHARFEVIDTNAGLAADAIGAIVEDDVGQFWISTTAGISRIGRNHQVVNFGAKQGTQERGYWINSATTLPDGRIVFGGLGGATLFNPHDVMPLPDPVPIVTDLLLQNAPVALRWKNPKSPLATNLVSGRRVVLSHDQNNITFEFSALVFADPDSLRYAYRLDGHDGQWIETSSSRRFATYTDLAPGSYTLRVRARHDGGSWTESLHGVDVRVWPAPWASPFAYAMYALALLAVIALVAWRMRINSRRRRAVQESIRLSEERLKLALWGSGSEMWDIDLASGKMHRDNRLDHLAVSHEAAEDSLQGYRPFVHPDDLNRFEKALSEHLKGRTPAFEASYRTTNTHHDWVWVLTRGRVVQRDENNRALRMSGTTSDITALNEALDALRLLNERLESRVEERTAALQGANQELRHTVERLSVAQRQLFEAEKLASLGGMVAGIAHEINTPLGIGVTAASHLHAEARRLSRQLESGQLQSGDLERFERTARESSDLILRNLQRADRLVKSFKQVAVDQSSEDRRVVDLGASLAEVLTTLGPSLKKTQHQVHLHCPSGLVVETAPGALYQIITNLVMNSLVHGFASSAAGHIHIEVVRQGNHILINYGDDGAGMDETVRLRIFEPFFTTRRGQGGSGLGMHIVYRLVTQSLNGSIECESAPAAGTHFFIRFEVGRSTVHA